MTNNSWQFWIDRGGTFTDIVAKAPDGQIIIHKLLSENPDRYQDAPVQGIREILGIPQYQPISSEEIEVIKMGTTVATNALLERKGDRTVLVITKGFKDALRVGYQNRPNIFAREIILPEMLYEKVIEVKERYTAKGEEIIPLQTKELTIQLQEVYAAGIRSCAIVLMHGYRYPKHEQKIKEIAQEIGFTQISVSHEVSPLMKLVSRGDTTVVDAYLSPILLRYVNQVSNSLKKGTGNREQGTGKENNFAKNILSNISERQPEKKGKGNREQGTGKENNFAKELLNKSNIQESNQLNKLGTGNGEQETEKENNFAKNISINISERQPVKLMFMQSNGGLTDAQKFQGKDSILSGPAGGIVGAVQTSKMAGFHQIISFDMGGTSTDVAHYAGAENKTIEYEREFETEIAGVRLRTPMMSIHTVAAGGGSILFFDGARYRVGPESAGANPGPAAYGKGGPLTVTDCNVMVGKIQPEFFPKVFGKDGNLPLNLEIVREKFTQLAAEIGNSKKPEEVASGYLAIAVEKMANAIKKISLEKGYDVSEYTLCCFGGAGGQHACLIADALGMKQIFIHPYAGVLSAYGMGLADIRVMKEKAVEKILIPELLPEIKQILVTLETEAKQEINSNQNQISLSKVHIKYQGSDSTLIVDFAENISIMKSEFETAHQQRYGFIMAEKSLIVEAVSLELIQQMETPEETENSPTQKTAITPITTTKIYTAGKWQNTPIYLRENLQPGTKINSPALIIEKTGTNIIEPGWQAELTLKNHLVLTKNKTTENQTEPTTKSQTKIPTSADPVMLEIFNNLFRAIAEQMGITLQKTGSSVNIKERLDFSCAIFDRDGQLVANAPHIPIHLGSMSESVNAVISDKKDILKPGDVYVLNNPYNGGTHLPDITVITPVFPPPQKTKDISLSQIKYSPVIAKQEDDKSITQKLKSVHLSDNEKLIWENQTNIFPETNTSEETLSDTNIGLDDKSITQKLKSVQLPGNEKLIWENQKNTFPETNTSEETLSDTKITLGDKSITQKLKSVQFPGEETLSDTKITLGDKSITQKLKSVQLPGEETLSDTNILGDKSITQKLKSIQLPGNEKLIWENQTNIFPETNSAEETLSDTNIALGDKFITQKLKSVQFPGNEKLIWENQTNIFPETNSAEETLSDTNIALGDKSITQKLKSVQFPGNEKLIWENQTNIFPETNSSEETLFNTKIALGDKFITQKLKSLQFPGEETLSDTNIGLEDKSITQQLKSVQFPGNEKLIWENQTNTFPETNSSEETLSDTNIGLEDKSITQQLKSVQLSSNEKLIWENQTNTFPETNSSEETLSDTNIGLEDKSITQQLKSVQLSSNENIISKNQTTTSLTPPEKTEKRETPIFYVASRGHHADIGGITPGSMPPHSKTIEEEGILIDNFQLVKNGKFQETEILNILTSGKYPARNTSQNIADLQAQIAANEKGTQELQKMTEKYGLETVQIYMKFVQNNAETSVRQAIKKLSSSLNKQNSTSTFDDGNKIQVSVSLDQKNLSAKIDFTGTSPQLSTNFNAPSAVCKAAVLYVFRTLVDDDIPLNAGCLKPLEIIIPEGSMLDPKYPAAIVAGNVETSQTIADTLYNALGIMASSQGTMNNFTFGNSKYQYYETICGGSGAGINFHGTDAVHTHMTNSRLTDPEVLEWRFPVLLENFAIRSDSGGKGLYKGGNGVIRKIRFLEQMTAGILSGHRVISPPGLNGGGNGLVGRNYVERSDGKIEELGSTATVEMNAGDVFVIETPGGGGVGKL
ncbi:hydantoinase B/oxoprolinase family protein [Okeania sp. SIO3B5]|uniref:hydantoinase B/oxoprolinase family protein n=1 Tax=Okeania sp. SIO3B5 TaxID=2607811 RepID=UPI003452F3CC